MESIDIRGFTLFFEKKIFEKFKGKNKIFAVRKGTCFAWGGP